MFRTNLQQFLDFVVEHEDESAAGSAKYVGESSLEEGLGSFLLGDGRPAVDGVLVEHVALGPAGLHHHAPTDRVEGVGDDAGHRGHGLSDGPADDDRSVLGVGQHAASGVVEAEVGGAVDDDALDGHSESSIETGQAVGLEGLGEAVGQAGVLALADAFADVSGETGPREIQRIDEAERGGPSGTSRRQVAGEVAPELGVLVDAP